jgi:hypothetical protein
MYLGAFGCLIPNVCSQIKLFFSEENFKRVCHHVKSLKIKGPHSQKCYALSHIPMSRAILGGFCLYEKQQNLSKGIP